MYSVRRIIAFDRNPRLKKMIERDLDFLLEENDIAVMITLRPIKIHGRVKPIRTAYANELQFLPGMLMVAGFGNTDIENTIDTDRLKYDSLPVIYHYNSLTNNITWHETFTRIQREQKEFQMRHVDSLDHHIGYGFVDVAPNKISCMRHGDSGAPIFIQSRDGEFVLIGIHIQSCDCRVYCRTDDKTQIGNGLYLRMYISWLKFLDCSLRVD